MRTTYILDTFKIFIIQTKRDSHNPKKMHKIVFSFSYYPIRKAVWKCLGSLFHTLLKILSGNNFLMGFFNYLLIILIIQSNYSMFKWIKFWLTYITLMEVLEDSPCVCLKGIWWSWFISFDEALLFNNYFTFWSTLSLSGEYIQYIQDKPLSA